MTERRATAHRAMVEVDPWFLGELMELPPGVRVIDVHIDRSLLSGRPKMLLHLEDDTGDHLPEVQEGALPRTINAQYRRQPRIAVEFIDPIERMATDPEDGTVRE